MENTTTATTTATLNKAFANAKLEKGLESDVYKVGNDIYKHAQKGVKLDNNQAELIEQLVSDCTAKGDYSPIERIGLKHKTFDFKEGNLGEKGEPLNCKAFKSAISRAFNNAGLDLSLQGCGKGGTPKVDVKQAPKGKAKAKAKVEDKEAKAVELVPSDNSKQIVWDYVVNNFTYDELFALSESWAHQNKLKEAS